MIDPVSGSLAATDPSAPAVTTMFPSGVYVASVIAPSLAPEDGPDRSIPVKPPQRSGAVEACGRQQAAVRR